MSEADPADRAAAWFERLVATTELALRKGQLGRGVGARNIIEVRKMRPKVAATCTHWTCPCCATVMVIAPPTRDGTILVCPCCYGVYDIEVTGS